MSGFHQVLIGGYSGGGLTLDRKPFLLANEAFSRLDNAYTWRERVKKREGLVNMGQLRRLFTTDSIGNSGASPWSFNIYSTLTSPITPEADAEIEPGSVSISIATIATPFVDQGDGTLTNATPGNSGTINYLTGGVILTHTAGAGQAATITFGYYPHLPVMGICKQDISTLGIDQTIFFDTTYAYQFSGGAFQELSSVAATTWTGDETQFFWTCNYQGATANLRYFFATNNNIDNGVSFDPIRYYDNSTWTSLMPLVDATNRLLQARILIPYYGRLLALNTWEGTEAAGVPTAVNYFARCRFSQLGDPLNAAAWRSDQFGRGGYLDAPTNEEIVSVAFYKNTLIVFFEYSTWQLRYIGEYGLPFIFERVSSDFGSVCTYSPIIFDQGVMTVSDRGIIQAGAGGVTRLDDQIPDTAFSFKIQEDAPNFVHGIRDFPKEVVYWNYVDTTTKELYQNFPNQVLLFNYRNNTWAKFRDSITCFGPAQFTFGITWDSLTTYWESSVSWDSVDDQQYVEYVTCGNQQGFVSIYEDPDAQTPVASVTMFGPSLFVKAVDLSGTPVELTIPNHNLANNEIIYLTNLIYDDDNPGLNNMFYNVSVIDEDTVGLSQWNGNNYDNVTASSTGAYIGGGLVSLMPKMNIVGKDFNPFQGNGKQFKISYIDFQLDSNNITPAFPGVSIQCFVNSYLGEQANVVIGNQELVNAPLLVGRITAANKDNPCQITSPGHSLSTGTVIYIANVEGMTELNSALYTITVVDADNFTLDGIDSTGFTTYIKGGIWNSSPVDGQVYTTGSEYAWYRFYSTQYGQYIRVGITYDDTLMNQLSTHQTPMELNAMNFWFREGGRLIN